MASLQDRFAAALIDRSLPAPDGISSRQGSPLERRFDVYRNSISASLTEALAVRYPVVNRLAGDAFFRAMSRHYVLSHLPTSPVLIQYGGGYPDFIAEFEPATGVPYLADVARLESAWWEAYHSADARPVSVEALAALPGDALPGLRLELLPSVKAVASNWPIVSLGDQYA
jgi:Putative DNA-binding domain